MAKEQLTIKDCYEEMERLLRLFLYSKNDTQDDEMYKQQLRSVFEVKGKIEQRKQAEAERKRAEREAIKLGIKR